MTTEDISEIPHIRPFDLSEMISSTFRIYKTGIFKFVLVAIIGAIPGIFSNILLNRMGFSFLRFQTYTPPSGSELLVMNILAIVSIIVTTWTTGITIHIASMIFSGDETNLGMSFKRATKNLHNILGTYLLLLLGYILLAIPITILIVIAFFIFPPASIAVAWLLALPVMIFFAIRLIFVIHTVFIEKQGPAGAISRTWKLVRSHWWRTFGILFLIWLFGVIVVIGCSFVPYAGVFIASILISPLSTIGITLVYWDLRARNQTISLEEIKSELNPA